MYRLTFPNGDVIEIEACELEEWETTLSGDVCLEYID